VSISGITLKGPGKDSATPLNVTAGQVNITKHASKMTTLRGIRFTGANQHFQISGTSANQFFRVHDCYFYTSNSYIGEVAANGGLFSLCEFYWNPATWQSGGNPLHVRNAEANAMWAAAHTMGASDTNGTANVYFEDCTWSNFRDGVPDTDNGGKTVMRYCVLNDTCVMCHGGGSGGSGNDSSQFGARHMEVYNNTFNRVLTTGNDAFNQWVYYRGSSGVVVNNVWEDPSTPDYPDKPSITLGVGNCAAGYPRQYQVGQSTQTPDATPDAPIMIYGNTGHTLVINREKNPNESCSNPTSMIVQDRDYKLTTGWWSPYTYPHPLRPT
jgi:hypothetical protein